MSPQIVLLPGDGIGPEVAAEAVRLLAAIGDFDIESRLIGGASIDAHGTALTDDTLAACGAADAVLLIAVGGPKWDRPKDPAAPRPEQGLFAVRKGLGLFANLRPIRPHAALAGISPLRPERLEGVDLIVVRELTGGIYFGAHEREGDTAHDTCSYSVGEIERVTKVAFAAARRKIVSVDKANVLETSRLWRETVDRLAAGDPRGLDVEHMLVDNAAMRLVSRPSEFDVLLTENLFGDVLSDIGAVLVGSIGLLPSASLGASGPGLFEPVHGSAPDITGRGIANPLATFLSVALMLRHGFDLQDEAAAVEAAVDSALHAGLRTPDLGGTATTREMTDAVLAGL